MRPALDGHFSHFRAGRRRHSSWLIEIDGQSLLSYACDGRLPAERDLFWEMGRQTAIRRGPWKLVLNGELVEGTPAKDGVHLANLDIDRGELRNLAAEQPEILSSLRQRAEAWRLGIEERWQREFSIEKQGTVTHPDPNE